MVSTENVRFSTYRKIQFHTNEAFKIDLFINADDVYSSCFANVESIMHYGKYDWAVNQSIPVITPRNKSITLQNAKELSKVSFSL